MSALPFAARAAAGILLLAACAGLALAEPAVTASATPLEQAPTVEQILARYLAARGGTEAWSAVQAMGWTGHIESGSEANEDVPFLMLFKRPLATRFEVVRQTQRSVRVFDGMRGWKLQPGGERGLEVLDYSAEELAAARDSCGLDGPLIDPVKKGVAITLVGSELLEGRKTWRLRVVLPSGAVQSHWIDAQDYRDLRYDRMARNAAGQTGTVSVYLRNYQQIGGLNLPLTLETRSPGGRGSGRMIIEKIALNPEVAADSFQSPATRPMRRQAERAAHGGVIVEAGDAHGSGSR